MAPMTTAELAQRYIAERGLNTADKRNVRLISKRVGACLRHYRAKKIVKSQQILGQALIWELQAIRKL